MGIFSAIGGVISSVVSSVGSFIGGVASKVGSAIGGFAKSVVGIIAEIPKIGNPIEFRDVIEFVGKVIHTVAELLGIKSEEEPEVLGAKAEQADKTIDDFDGDAEAYIRYLKEEVELDKKRFENMTPEEKLGCKAVGLSLETKAIEKKLGGVEITPESIAMLGKIHMADGVEIDAKTILSVVKSLKEAGITNMNDVVEYLEGKGESDRIKTGLALKQAIGEGADDKINQLKEAVRGFEEE